MTIEEIARAFNDRSIPFIEPDESDRPGPFEEGQEPDWSRTRWDQDAPR